MPRGMSISELEYIADVAVNQTVQQYRDGSNDMTFLIMLFGWGHYKLEAFPGAGHNHYCIMDAIYRYHAHHPEHEIDKIFFNRMVRSIEIMANIRNYNLMMKYIFTCLDQEKAGTATFHTDVPKLLDVVTDTLFIRRLYFEDKLIEEAAEEHNEFLKKKYGLKLW